MLVVSFREGTKDLYRDIPWMIRLFYDLIELQATRPQQVLEPQIFSKIKSSTCKRTMFQNGVCLCVCVRVV